MPLTTLARTLGYHTVVMDGRPRFATRERFADVDELRIGIPSEMIREHALTPSAALANHLRRDGDAELVDVGEALARGEARRSERRRGGKEGRSRWAPDP